MKICNKLIIPLCALSLVAGCSQQPPSPATISALSAEFNSARVVVDSDCIFSAPVKNKFVAYRVFGLCLFSDSQLRLYYGGEKPALAFAWSIADIKSYAFYTDTFILVTDAGNFGLVVKDAPGFVAVLQEHRVPEDGKLPQFRAKDPSPFNWM